MIEMRLEQSLTGEMFVNTFHITGVDATAANANAIAQGLVDAWTASLLNRLHAGWQINRVLYREYPAPPNSPYLSATVAGLPLTGQGSETGLLATHTAMRINTFSNVNPPYSGSFFLGGFTAGQIINTGTFGAGTMLSAVTLADELINLGVNTGLDVALGIRSRGTNTVPADTTSVVAQLQVMANPASLDSRRKNQGV